MIEKNRSGIMYRTIDTWIDIEATPKDIWEVLCNFNKWAYWNTFIPLVEGDLVVGKKIRIRVTPPGLKPMTFRPKVFEVIKHEKILWGGSFLWVVYRGDHAFLLEPISKNKTRFRQIEHFRGPMVIFMSGMIEKTKKGYNQMNSALKKEVESKKSEML